MTDPRIMNLNAEETAFLRQLIAVHREYYSTLIANHGCTPANRDKYHFIEGLWRKLSPETTETNKTLSVPRGAK